MIIVLRYGGDNIKAMLVGVIMNLKNACVEVSKSRSMHVWLKLCNKFETCSVPGL